MSAPAKEFRTFEALLDGGIQRLDRVHAFTDKLPSETYITGKGLMLAVLANYVPDEVWDHAIAQSFAELAGKAGAA